MSEAPPKRHPRRSWPFLEAEMRNQFMSVPPPRSQAPEDDVPERLPYSTWDLPSWQVEIVDRFPLLYRCPEVGGEDYCHLANGFACGQEWAPVICAMSEIAQALVSALRGSVQPEARITVADVTEADGTLRWRINANIAPPFLDFLYDYFRG